MEPVAGRQRETFYTLLTRAMADIATHGFDGQARLDYWLKRLRLAAREALVPEPVLEQALREGLARVFRQFVGKGVLRRHPGVSEFTIEQLEPRLRAELRRRIVASADLIKLNRTASIERTMQRFAGWASSIPRGGGATPERREDQRRIRRGIAALPFEERRVIVDQGHKLAAALDDVIAIGGGAIVGIWHSRWREAGYDYREDHKERDGHVFVVPGNWALERGFMRLAGAQYTDEVTAPGQEINCRCRYEYRYNLRDLPVKMLSAKGRAELALARRVIAATA